MASRLAVILLIVCVVLGCAVHRKPMEMQSLKHLQSPYRQFIAKNIDWSSIHRVVLVPVANQSAFPNVPFEIQTNLAAELQRAGIFEIVVAKTEDPYLQAQDVFASGQFNEIEAVRVAREHQADAILFASVTQYNAYKPPRLGLSLLMVSPAEGIVIASLSGLWDTREAQTLELAQAYLRQTQNWPRSLMAQDRIVEMPDVFQRFVCQQVAATFHPFAAQPVSVNGINSYPGVLNEGTIPVESGVPQETVIPPMPPPSSDFMSP